MHALKGLALLHASQSYEIALSSSPRLRSTLVQCQSFSHTILSQKRTLVEKLSLVCWYSLGVDDYVHSCLHILAETPVFIIQAGGPSPFRGPPGAYASGAFDDDKYVI